MEVANDAEAIRLRAKWGDAYDPTKHGPWYEKRAIDVVDGRRSKDRSSAKLASPRAGSVRRNARKRERQARRANQ